MCKNKSGSLHLGNGYSLNFDYMIIENNNEIQSDSGLDEIFKRYRELCIRYANIEHEKNFPSAETDKVWDDICSIENEIKAKILHNKSKKLSYRGFIKLNK